MKAPALHADPRYLQAFGELMKKIEQALPSIRGKPVRVCVAGGAALHLYTGARYSRDVDARIDLPKFVLPAGQPRSIAPSGKAWDSMSGSRAPSRRSCKPTAGYRGVPAALGQYRGAALLVTKCSLPPWGKGWG